MKYVILITLFATFYTTNLYAQLTKSDLNEIRLIVKDEIETAIQASEKRMRNYVDLKVHVLDNKLTGEIKRLDTKIDSLDKSINRNFQLILTLIGFVTIVVGIPQIIVIFQNRKYKLMLENIEYIKNSQ